MVKIQQSLVVVGLAMLGAIAETFVRQQAFPGQGADGIATVSSILVGSRSGQPQSLVRDARQHKSIEVDADGNIEIFDHFANSKRKPSQSLIRDAKQQKNPERDADGTVEIFDHLASSTRRLLPSAIRDAKPQNKMEIDAHGVVEVIDHIAVSTHKRSPSIIRDTGQEKSMEIYANGKAEVFDHFTDSIRKLSPGPIRDAKQQQVVENDTDGNVESFHNIAESTRKLSASSIRAAKQQQPIEIDVNDKIEIIEHFGESSRKLLPSLMRDAKQQKVMEIDGTQSNENQAENHVSAHVNGRGAALIHVLTDVSKSTSCNESSCLSGEDCFLVKDGMCWLADGSCGRGGECQQASSAGRVQKNGSGAPSGFQHPDEPTRRQWTLFQRPAQIIEMSVRSDAPQSSILESKDLIQSIGSKPEDALIDGAQLTIATAPPEQTRELNPSRDMAMQAVQNVTAMSRKGSAEMSQQKDQERQSRLASFAPSNKRLTMMMLTSFTDEGQLVVRSVRNVTYSPGFLLGVPLVLIVAIGAISLYYWFKQRRRAEHEVVVREVGALRTAIVKVLQARKGEDWQGTLSNFIKLRSDKVNDNHPCYGTISEHFGDSSIQSQVQKLFLQLSGGEELIHKEAIEMMCSGFRIVITNLDSGGDPYPYTPRTPKDYRWFVDCIDHPLPCSDFVTIFVFWLAYIMQLGGILLRKDHATQAARGDSVDQWGVEYFVDVREQCAYHARMTTCSFDRVGSRVFAKRDVEEISVRAEQHASLAEARI